MATIIPVNASLGILRWTTAGDPEEMICTVGFVGTPEQSAETQCGLLYDAAVDVDSITPASAMNNPGTFVGVTVYKRLSGEPVVAEFVQPINQTVGSQTSLPTNCALLMKKQTSRGGRQGRGRCFLPSILIDEASVDTNGTITSSTYNLIASRVTKFYNEMVANEIQPALFHADGSTADIVTSFSLDTRIATQRQRMRR